MKRIFSEFYGNINASDACVSPRGGIIQCEWFVWNYATNMRMKTTTEAQRTQRIAELKKGREI